MRVDGVDIVTRYFQHGSPGPGIIYYGNLGFGDWDDMIYRFEYVLPHSANDVTVSFSCSNMEGIGNESWGIDNFTGPGGTSCGSTDWLSIDQNEFIIVH